MFFTFALTYNVFYFYLLLLLIIYYLTILQESFVISVNELIEY